MNEPDRRTGTSDESSASLPPQRRVGLSRTGTVAVAVVALLAVSGLVVAAGAGLLYLFNPVADEWVCSQGKAPATYRQGGSACFRKGAELPDDAQWHPFGNRPMPYNCDKEGWVLIERTVTRRGASDSVRDCVREGTDLPGEWRVVRQE